MAAIDPVIVELEGLIDGPGDSHRVAGAIDIDSYEIAGKTFDLEQGISYDAVFTNAGEGILLTGMVRAKVTGTCDRCLDPASFEIAGEIEEYYLFEEPDEAPGDDEDDFEVLGPERRIDLAEPVLDAVVMDTPFVVLCSDDCRGLCPRCGCNLNREQCDCAQKAADERAESDDNPFAALKNLKLDD